MQFVKVIYELVEFLREFFRLVKKGEYLGLSWKGNFRFKMVKKKFIVIVNIIQSLGGLEVLLWGLLNDVLGFNSVVFLDMQLQECREYNKQGYFD